MKTIFFLILSVFAIHFSMAQTTQASEIIRGPYIQNATTSSIVVHWRTSEPTLSQIKFSKKIGKKGKMIVDNVLKTEHEISIPNLKTNTKYFYKIASSKKDELVDAKQYFKTNPKIGSEQAIRIWALGDFGCSSQNQYKVKDAIVNFTKDTPIDAWIWQGDNAYNIGTDAEFQKHVFRVYQEDFFKNTVSYPAPGNHDYAGQHDSSLPPYFKIFNMPSKGEAGGLASGTESFYSVDYGNVHLVSLNSEEKSEDGTYLYDSTGTQATWLKKDLANNKLPWVIAYWHKPSYSKGSHDSDTEDFMYKIREGLNPILEKFRVDLAIMGHSHVYERTHPMRGHLGKDDTFSATQHVFAPSNSTSEYNLKKGESQGTIYIVNGSGGQLGGKQPGFPLNSAIYTNTEIGGSMIIDVEGRKLNAKWIASNGQVLDKFIITKEK
jgi:acid phosphatase type 7